MKTLPVVGLPAVMGLSLFVAVAGIRTAPASMWRQEAPGATLVTDTTEIHVGDLLTARLSVRHAVNATVRWPDSLDLRPFEVSSFQPGPTVIEDGEARSTASLTITAFELGELEIPSIDLTLIDESGGESSVATNPVVVGVTSVGLDEGGDIRDVKGPRSIARNWWLLWPWAAGLVLAAALGYWVARRRRAGAAPVKRQTARPARPPHEIAYEALARLESSALLEQGEIKRYHIGVSQIMREYIEGRFRVRALELITPEIVAELVEAGVEGEVRAEVQDFLNACDLVKFARHRPGPRECRALLALARRLVDVTRPPPVSIAS